MEPTSTAAYDAGSRVLFLSENAKNPTTLHRTSYRWCTATDSKIYQTWEKLNKDQFKGSPDYTLAKRQIQEVTDRHSSGLFGWFTRFYHRILNLFGAGITKEQEKKLGEWQKEPAKKSVDVLQPQKNIPEEGEPLDHSDFTVPERFATLVNSKILEPSKNRFSVYLGSIGQLFGAAAWSWRRDPNSIRYNIGFKFTDLNAIKKAIQSALGVTEDFFEKCSVDKEMLWFSGAQTEALLKGTYPGQTIDAQAHLEQLHWYGSKIKISGGVGLLYDDKYIKQILTSFGNLNQKTGNWSLVIDKEKFKEFQERICLESAGCIVCPEIEAQTKDSQKLVVIQKLDGEKIKIYFEKRFSNLMEFGYPYGTETGEDDEDFAAEFVQEKTAVVNKKAVFFKDPIIQEEAED